MALAGATGPAHLSSSDPSPLPLRPALQSHSQVDLGSVNHTGDNVASPNYGAQVGGHIVGLDQSQIHVTTSNAHHYNLAAGTILNIATGAVDERMVIIDWLGSLSGLDFSSMHRANLSKRHHGTGMWFLEYEKFIAWCDGSIRTLWCHGILGSGKTILSSIVIEHLEETQRPAATDAACIFVFFNHQDKGEQAPYNLTIELLKQLVCQHIELSDQVRRLYAQCKPRATPPRRDQLLAVIQHEVQRFSKVRLVIDALDECPAHAKENTREDFLGMIRNLPANVSLLVTSRQRTHARCGLDPVHEIEITVNENDLHSYIRGQIEEHSSHNEQLAKADPDAIINSVCQKAAGMFLLARLHMNDIAAQRTHADLQSALENLPSDIHETYDKAMHRIPTHDMSLAESIFLWVAFSMRPLTVHELQSALATKEGVTNATTARLHMYDEGCLSTVCAGLVTIDPDPSAPFIRLVHPTAESYFRNRYEHEKAHSTIATTCLRYLLFEDLKVHVPDLKQLFLRLQELPFLRYAVLRWGDHARDTQDPETVNFALTFLGQKANLLSAAQVIDFIEDDNSISALWLAAHFGLCTVVDRLLSTRPDALTETMYGETAMHTAADRGHLSVVDRLCSEPDIEPDLTGDVMRTPLSLAAENGHHAVVQRLLFTSKVDPDSKTASAFYQGRTPLSWAAGNGHEETVRNLLATGKVEVDSTITAGSYFGRTPLMWAAAHGHPDVVELLLDQGKANPALEDGDGRTALSYAAQNGHEKVVQLLLQTGRAAPNKKDVFNQRAVELAYKSKHEGVVRLLLTYPSLDFKDEEGRTILSHEAVHRHAGLVKLLLDYGADPNATDEEDWSPLTYSAGQGNVEVAKMLLERGADPDIQCIDSRTPFSYAAEAGHQQMIQLLLSHGAHTDTPDRYGRTPLSYAAEAGHESTVTFLLSCGQAIDPDSQSTSGPFPGRTPLSWAAGKGRIKVVEALLKRGVDVNLKRGASSLASQGPVMWAALNGHEEVVRMLMATGRVELRAEDRLFGKGAMEWARENGFSFV